MNSNSRISRYTRPALSLTRANQWLARACDAHADAGLLLTDDNFDTVAGLLQDEWIRTGGRSEDLDEPLAAWNLTMRCIGTWLRQTGAEEKYVLSAAALTCLVDTVASAQRASLLALGANDLSPQGRFFFPIWESACLTVTLHLWSVSPSPDHDHGRSVGSMNVLSPGCLVEEVWDARSNRWESFRWDGGSAHSFDDMIHRVVNANPIRPAYSLHAYSRQLTEINYYIRGSDGRPIWDREWHKGETRGSSCACFLVNAWQAQQPRQQAAREERA